MLIARVVHLVVAVLWISATVGGWWAARRLRRDETRTKLFLLVGLGSAVGAHNLVLATTVARPLRPIHLATITLLGIAGILALVLNVRLGQRLAREESLLRVLSHGRLDTAGSAAGRSSRPLSPREVDVLGRLCRGQDSDQIASELYLSRNTVETHIRNLRRKLRVSSRVGAVSWAVRTGTYDPETGRIDPLTLLRPPPTGAGSS